jgi:hypothetical protein
MAMKRSNFWKRLQAATAAAAALAVIAVPFGQASAADDEESPFGDAVKVADASLDTMRGGFDTAGGNLLRFAVNVQTAVNGTPIASLSVDNLKGQVEAAAVNLGRTVTINGNGNVQIQSAAFGGAAQAGGPVTITTTLMPTVSAAGTSIASGRTLPTALSNVVSGSGTLLATTTLLPDSRGLLTLVQNVNSNVAVHMVTTLNVQLSGLSGALIHNAAATRAFASSMSMSVRH